MEPLGQKYFDLFNHFPLRPILDDLEYVAADDLCEVLRTKLLVGELHADEVAYLEVLELLVIDYDEGGDDQIMLFDELDDILEPAGEECCEICGEPMADHIAVDEDEADDSDTGDIAEDLRGVLEEQKEKLQEWDFVALCNNLSAVISAKMAELERG